MITRYPSILKIIQNYSTNSNSILECTDISERVLITPWCSMDKKITQYNITFTRTAVHGTEIEDQPRVLIKNQITKK